jgi:hypothetical protein
MQPPTSLDPIPPDHRDEKANIACAKLNPDSQDRFFIAPDERAAVRAAWTLRTVQAEVTSSYPVFPFDCSDLSNTDCKRTFSQLPLSSLEWIGDCDRIPAAPGNQCWLFIAGGNRWRIEVDRNYVPQKVSETTNSVIVADRRRN